MSVYKPRKFRPLSVIAKGVRIFIQLLQMWPLLLLTLCLLSPIGPHMRVKYTYEQRGSMRYMLSCTYLGARGFVPHRDYGHCPWFVILDGRSGQRVHGFSQILQALTVR